jgi:hypothetical protein
LYEELLHNNLYCRELRRIGATILKAENDEFSNAQSIQAQINSQTNRFEVGVIISHDNPGQMIYKYNLNNESFSIPTMSSQLEPLVYPLLYPHGENGWNKQTKINFMPYLASRFLMPERDSESPTGFLQRLNKAGDKMLPTNRFQLMSRVAQHFVVEGVSRLIDSHLSFVKANNGFILEKGAVEDRPSPAIDSSREEMNVNSKTFLNDSVTGSPRHLKKLAMNALHIVSEFGKPHCFLTLTANPNWPEIQERLFPGQTAYDRYRCYKHVLYKLNK